MLFYDGVAAIQIMFRKDKRVCRSQVGRRVVTHVVFPIYIYSGGLRLPPILKYTKGMITALGLHELGCGTKWWRPGPVAEILDDGRLS